ncbi:MAG: T9SS type A sorting domain-containing protein [Salibacteraceae bacterium]
MRKLLLLGGITMSFIGASVQMNAQTRYMDEIFTDADIMVASDVTYGTNVDYMKNTQLLDPTYLTANQATVFAEMTTLKTAFQNGGAISASHYTPFQLDSSTLVKVSDMKMDVYYPNSTVDTMSNRPVMLYVHTGNFLPTGVNGGPAGSKNDSAAVELCKQWAKRGYVAIAANYRHGWNPVASGPTGGLVRRATLLNAVYRAIHDMKQVVRVVRDDAANANTYGIDGGKIALYGQGSGGYVSVAYNTLDKSSEMELPKFSFPGGGGSFINEAVVGGIAGEDGLLNMYYNNGQTTEIQACVNAGGALADISWLEGNIEAPMISIHAIRDAYAPFDTGTVIVPTTQEDVVDVNGPNMFITKAVALGLNDSFKDLPLTDAYTASARSKYGQSFTNIPLININDPVVVDASAEGLFAIDFDLGNGAPWEWWSLTDLQNLEAYYASIGVTIDAAQIHSNALLTNSTMSKSQALTFIDSIQGYIHPRIMRSMEIGEWEVLSTEEIKVNDVFSIAPNPAKELVTISSKGGNVNAVSIYDMTGKLVSTRTSNVPTLTFNVNDLSKGVYIISVSTDKGQNVEKLIIE